MYNVHVATKQNIDEVLRAFVKFADLCIHVHCNVILFCRKDKLVQSLQSELRSAPKQDYVDK